TGYQNTANGQSTLVYNITGYNNTANGMDALLYNTSATSTTAIGQAAAQGTASYNAGYLTAIGAGSLYSITTGAENNTALGYNSGYGVTTGANNLLLGYKAGDNLTTGSNNIVVGYNIDTPAVDSANTLNIGNLIYATGVDGTGTTLSSGSVGIGTTTPISTLTVVGSGCFSVGAGATLACGTTPGNIYYTTANTGNYDVAERYKTYDTSLQKGDVITFDTTHPFAVEKASSPKVSFIGVVSSNPGILLGGADASMATSTSVPVALSGRVPVKVSIANGNISVGDRLTISSSTPGVAVKLVGSGSYLGEALERYSGNASGTIFAFINPGMYYGDISVKTATTTSKGVESESLVSMLGKIGASFSDAVLHVKKLAADTFYAVNIFSKSIKTDNATVGSATHPAGITLYDTVTGKPYCLSIANGVSTSVPGVCKEIKVSGSEFASSTGNTSTTTAGNGGVLTLKLKGETLTKLLIGSKYTEEGATVSGGTGTTTYNIYVNGSLTATSSPWIDTSASQTYILTYSAKDGVGDLVSVTRTVSVGGTASSTSTGASTGTGNTNGVSGSTSGKQEYSTGNATSTKSINTGSGTKNSIGEGTKVSTSTNSTASISGKNTFAETKDGNSSDNGVVTVSTTYSSTIKGDNTIVSTSTASSSNDK
ncbi:hypothetical protein MNBD_CPR01-90, partial [hydrothermal vent metagenome]